MADLKQNIIESFRIPRGFAERLGYKNIMTATTESSKGFMQTALEGGLQFFDRTSILKEGKAITQGGTTYGIDLTDGHLPPETIEFFARGFSSYLNYNAIVDTMQDFFDVYAGILENNPGLDVAGLVGDAILNPKDTPGSLKLDVLYFKNQSMGSLRQKCAGFEDALHYIFGPYVRNSGVANENIVNFVNDVCQRFLADYEGETPEFQNQIRGKITNSIQNALERSTERANYVKNINVACGNMIENFSGLTRANYGEKIDAYIAHLIKIHEGCVEPEGKDGVLERDARVACSNSVHEGQQYVDNLNAIIENRSILEYWHSRYEFSDEKEFSLKDAKSAVEKRRETARSIVEGYEKTKAYNAKQPKSGRLPLPCTLQEYIESKKDIKQCDFELKVLSGEKIDRLFIYEGKQYNAVPPYICQRNIDDCETANKKIVREAPAKDARLILTCCSILYSLNTNELGGEIKIANDVLSQIGFDRSDIDFSDEQQVQAMSIINILHYLNEEASHNEKDGGRLVQTVSELRKYVYDITAKYTDPKEDGTLPEGKLDRRELVKSISKLCADPNNTMFFERGKELMEQYGVAMHAINEAEAIKAINPVMLSIKKMDPRLKNVSYRNALMDFYKKQGLIPAKVIKIGDIKYSLPNEYKPHNLIDEKPTKPVLPVNGDLKKLDYCEEMVKVIDKWKKYIDSSKTTNTADVTGDLAKANRFTALQLEAVSKVFKKCIGDERTIFDLTKAVLEHPELSEYTLATGEKIKMDKDTKVLFLKFAPLEGTALFGYYDKIHDYNLIASKIEERMRENPNMTAEDLKNLYEEYKTSPEKLAELYTSLKVYGDFENGKSNTILPRLLNEGVKFSFSQMTSSQFDTEKGFIYKIGNTEFSDFKSYFHAFQQLAIQEQGKLESVLGEKFSETVKGLARDPKDAEEIARMLRNTSLLIVKDGELTFVPEYTSGKRGGLTQNDTFDVKSQNQHPSRVSLDNITNTDKIWTLDGEGKLISVSKAEFNDKDMLIKVDNGNYIPSKQYSQVYDKFAQAANGAGAKALTYEQYLKSQGLAVAVAATSTSDTSKGSDSPVKGESGELTSDGGADTGAPEDTKDDEVM